MPNIRGTVEETRLVAGCLPTQSFSRLFTVPFDAYHSIGGYGGLGACPKCAVHPPGGCLRDRNIRVRVLYELLKNNGSLSFLCRFPGPNPSHLGLVELQAFKRHKSVPCSNEYPRL